MNGIIIAAVGLLAGIAAISAEYRAWHQTITVAFEELADPGLPIPLRFHVKNHGPFQLQGVSFRCFMKRVDTGGILSVDSWVAADWSGTRRVATTLRVGDEASVECGTTNRNFGGQPREADLALVVFYKTTPTPWKRSEAFRFVKDPALAGPSWTMQPVPEDYFVHDVKGEI